MCGFGHWACQFPLAKQVSDALVDADQETAANTASEFCHVLFSVCLSAKPPPGVDAQTVWKLADAAGAWH